MSAWDVYWVMQLDSIREVANFITAFSFVGTLVFLLFWFGCRIENTESSRRVSRPLSVGLILSAFALFVSGAVVAFMPSTKTMCVALILPEIVNNERLADDAKEIYDLAVNKMKEVLVPREAK